jgi:hypothetical protein
MKNYQKWALAFSTILLLTVTSCAEKPKEDKDKPKYEEHEDDEMAKAPDGIITLDEAKVLCTNYEDRRIEGIKSFEMAKNPEKEFIPTQFIDFDFETIRKYVKYVERKAKKANIEPDSLRIYLGNYGKDGKDPNRNTVFILPTATVNGKHGGFYINSDGNAELIRNYWPESQDGQKSKAGFLPSLNMNLYQDGSLILNDGSSAPPPKADF